MAGQYRLCLAVSFLALATARVPAQSTVPAYRARVLGVFDEMTGEPIEGVRILDLASGNSAQTTQTGTVSLLFLPDGGSLIRLSKIGYQPQMKPVAISPSDTVPITLIMRRVTELPTVVTTDSAPHFISPALRAFEERRRIEAGYFITEPELRKAEGRLLANLLLSKVPGVRVRNGSGSASYLLASARCAGGGPPQVYLDGVPLAALAPTAPFNLNEFNTSELAAVEYYPDNNVAPMQFEHTSRRCGALLLWTRER